MTCPCSQLKSDYRPMNHKWFIGETLLFVNMVSQS